MRYIEPAATEWLIKCDGASRAQQQQPESVCQVDVKNLIRQFRTSPSKDVGDVSVKAADMSFRIPQGFSFRTPQKSSVGKHEDSVLNGKNTASSKKQPIEGNKNSLANMSSSFENLYDSVDLRGVKSRCTLDGIELCEKSSGKIGNSEENNFKKGIATVNQVGIKPVRQLDAKSLIYEEKQKFAAYKIEYIRQHSSGDEKDKCSRDVNPVDQKKYAPSKEIPSDEYIYVLRKIHHESKSPEQNIMANSNLKQDAGVKQKNSNKPTQQYIFSTIIPKNRIESESKVSNIGIWPQITRSTALEQEKSTIADFLQLRSRPDIIPCSSSASSAAGKPSEAKRTYTPLENDSLHLPNSRANSALQNHVDLGVGESDRCQSQMIQPSGYNTRMFDELNSCNAAWRNQKNIQDKQSDLMQQFPPPPQLPSQQLPKQHAIQKQNHLQNQYSIHPPFQSQVDSSYEQKLQHDSQAIPHELLHAKPQFQVSSFDQQASYSTLQQKPPKPKPADVSLGSQWLYNTSYTPNVLSSFDVRDVAGPVLQVPSGLDNNIGHSKVDKKKQFITEPPNNSRGQNPKSAMMPDVSHSQDRNRLSDSAQAKINRSAYNFNDAGNTVNRPEVIAESTPKKIVKSKPHEKDLADFGNVTIFSLTGYQTQQHSEEKSVPTQPRDMRHEYAQNLFGQYSNEISSEFHVSEPYDYTGGYEPAQESFSSSVPDYQSYYKPPKEVTAVHKDVEKRRPIVDWPDVECALEMDSLNERYSLDKTSFDNNAFSFPDDMYYADGQRGQCFYPRDEINHDYPIRIYDKSNERPYVDNQVHSDYYGRNMDDYSGSSRNVAQWDNKRYYEESNIVQAPMNSTIPVDPFNQQYHPEYRMSSRSDTMTGEAEYWTDTVCPERPHSFPPPVMTTTDLPEPPRPVSRRPNVSPPLLPAFENTKASALISKHTPSKSIPSEALQTQLQLVLKDMQLRQKLMESKAVNSSFEVGSKAFHESKYSNMNRGQQISGVTKTAAVAASHKVGTSPAKKSLREKSSLELHISETPMRKASDISTSGERRKTGQYDYNAVIQPGTLSGNSKPTLNVFMEMSPHRDDDDNTEELPKSVAEIKSKLFGPGERDAAKFLPMSKQNSASEKSLNMSHCSPPVTMDTPRTRGGKIGAAKQVYLEPVNKPQSLPSSMNNDNSERLYNYVSYRDGQKPKRSNIFDELTDLERTYEQLNEQDSAAEFSEAHK